MEPQSSQLARREIDESVDAPAALPVPRILIDARKVGDGGIGTYTSNLVTGLLELNVPVAVVASPERLEGAPWRNDVRVIVDRAAGYSFDEYFMLARRIPFEQFDLYHAPHYTLPFGVPIRTVVTVHDLIHLSHPEHFYYPWAARLMIRSAVARADRVIAVSRATMAELEQRRLLRGAEMQRVRVVPNALSPALAAAEIGNGSGAARQRQYGRYLLAITSQAKPHKGVFDLVRAFAAVKRAARAGAAPAMNGVTLVLAGYGASALAESGGLLDALEARNDVVVAGTLTADELIGYIAGACGMVVPSLIEGFGLPMLDAHALGVPVAHRPVPALRELSRPFDAVARDFSVEALQEALLELVEKSARMTAESRRRLVSEARAYSCASAARATLQVYREAVG